MKLCSRCNINERISDKNTYCRPCKSSSDLKSYHKNKEKRLKYNKEYKELNPDKVEKERKQTKEWIKNNPGYMNQWMKNKREKDTSFKLNHYLSSRLHLALKGKKQSNTLVSYLGCSLLYLKQHIENKFSEGMSWDNYGTWHIDHIKPVSSFNLNDEEQIKECWCYKNLQPLWAKDNLKKSNKISYEFKTHSLE
jgi:hypothetical protein